MNQYGQNTIVCPLFTNHTWWETLCTPSRPLRPLSHVLATIKTRKTPVQRLADKVAGKLTWLVFAAAASTLLFWGALSPLLLAGSLLNEFPALAEALAGAPAVAAASESAGSMWVLGLRLAVDVCLVACPCSLGLATPTAVMASDKTGGVSSKW